MLRELGLAFGFGEITLFNNLKYAFERNVTDNLQLAECECKKAIHSHSRKKQNEKLETTMKVVKKIFKSITKICGFSSVKELKEELKQLPVDEIFTKEEIMDFVRNNDMEEIEMLLQSFEEFFENDVKVLKDCKRTINKALKDENFEKFSEKKLLNTKEEIKKVIKAFKVGDNLLKECLEISIEENKQQLETSEENSKATQIATKDLNEDVHFFDYRDNQITVSNYEDGSSLEDNISGLLILHQGKTNNLPDAKLATNQKIANSKNVKDFLFEMFDLNKSDYSNLINKKMITTVFKSSKNSLLSFNLEAEDSMKVIISLRNNNRELTLCEVCKNENSDRYYYCFYDLDCESL